MAQSTKIPEAVKGKEVTKSPEVAISSEETKSSKVVKYTEVANLSDSLLNTWAEGLDRVFTTQKELEDLFLQALESQQELWEKLHDNFQIEAEQKKLFEDIRESTKLSLQSILGQSANNVVDQCSSKIDGVTDQLQELTLKTYNENLSLLFRQSQDQYKQFVQNGFEQQQKIREEYKNQIKSAQQNYFSLYEDNMKFALSFFK